MSDRTERLEALFNFIRNEMDTLEGDSQQYGLVPWSDLAKLEELTEAVANTPPGEDWSKRVYVGKEPWTVPCIDPELL